jgi:hypothetical protein
MATRLQKNFINQCRNRDRIAKEMKEYLPQPSICMKKEDFDRVRKYLQKMTEIFGRYEEDPVDQVEPQCHPDKDPVHPKTFQNIQRYPSTSKSTLKDLLEIRDESSTLKITQIHPQTSEHPQSSEIVKAEEEISEPPTNFIISEVQMSKEMPDYYDESEIVNYEPSSVPDSEIISLDSDDDMNIKTEENDSELFELLSDDQSETFSSASEYQPASKKTKNSRIKYVGDRRKCNECHKLVTRKSFTWHVSQHKFKNLGRVFQCSVCKRLSYVKMAIKVHLSRVHNVEVALADIEPAILARDDPILINFKHDENLRKFKNGDRNIECPVCMKSFGKDYNQHFMRHKSAGLPSGLFNLM